MILSIFDFKYSPLFKNSGLRRQANISLQNYYAHNRKQQEEESLVIKKI